ncbi:MAG: bifunctional folylpolyglutamate synthase/dihydrofolate synthase [Deltaproteobacteria bacterium]|nr:bifunctional folylpolyglutamate synthase/dihydrofolate synthase [Deltaproteobacteria bacterium]
MMRLRADANRPEPTPPPGAAYVRALERLLASPTLPRLGLARMHALCAALGEPQHAVPVLHVAGTKGKGSTTAIAASILRAAGLRVGTTTSPHLLSARERLTIDGEPVDEDTFVALEERVHRAAAGLDLALEVPSFFEQTTAMAFGLFAGLVGGRPVDVAVVEVGLGGRLDATNVVQPRAAAITRLGLDHVDFLGDTLAAIAFEKAGIIKAGVPLVTVPQVPEAAAVVAARAAALGAPLSVVADDGATLPVALVGAHQQENARLAVALVRAGSFAVADDVVARGLFAVRWPARYETVSQDPVVIVDGAHNVDSARALATTLREDGRVRRCHFVVGLSRGHDPATFCAPLLPGAASVVATSARQARAWPAEDVARAAGRHAPVDVVPDVVAAVAVAVLRARADGGAVVVTGSLFVAGEARACFLPMARDPERPAW